MFGDKMEEAKERIKDFFENNSKKIVIFSIAFFAVIIGIIIAFGNKYTKYEKEMISLASKYFQTNTNVNYVTLKELNKSYDTCNDYSGVYYKNGKYTAYLFCNDYVSSDEVESNKNLTLNGGNPLVLKTSDVYQEPGYYSSYEVEIISDYQSNIEGIYFIKYIARDSNKKRVGETTRIIIVNNNFNSNNSIILKGSKELYIFKNDAYQEAGYSAYDELGNDISNQVKVDGVVNTKKPGQQKITYTVDVGNYKKMTAERIVNVLDVVAEIELENDKPTLNKNTINVTISGQDYEYTVLPNNLTSKEKSIEYPVDKNGTYIFKVYSNNMYITKAINVNQIYGEIVGSCTITENVGKKVYAEVKASGGYGTLQYSYLDKTNYTSYLSNSNYIFTNRINETKIKIKDSINNVKEITCSNPTIKVDKLEIHFIKIESGRFDAILFRLGDKTLFIDGGDYYNSHYNTIDSYLKALKVDHIDIIVGSHGHRNHVGPQAELIRNYNVKQAYYNQDIYHCVSCQDGVYDNIIKALKEKNVTPVVSTLGSIFYFGDVKFETIGPHHLDTYPNGYSTNYLVTYEGVKMLFTGDGIQQSDVLAKYDASFLDIDILKYPHHGQHSLTAAFVNAIRPEYVVVTNHMDTVYSDAKKNLNNVGAKFYQHYKDGNIVIIIDDGKITFKTNVNPSTYTID